MFVWLHDDNGYMLTELKENKEFIWYTDICQIKTHSDTNFYFLRSSNQQDPQELFSPKIDHIIYFCEDFDSDVIENIINKYKNIITKETTFFVFTSVDDNIKKEFLYFEKNLKFQCCSSLYKTIIYAIKNNHYHKTIKPNIPQKAPTKTITQEQSLILSKLDKIIVTTPITAEEMRLNYVANLISTTNDLMYKNKSILSHKIYVTLIPDELVQIIVLYYEKLGYTVELSGKTLVIK